MSAASRKAWFLDRDGTLNFDTHHVHDPDEVALIPGVRAGLARARELGYRLYLISNQSGVGRGYFTMDDVWACNRRLVELLGLGEDVFAGVCVAPDHPDQPGPYRKPSPRFLLEMIARDGLDPTQCYMLGDRPSDWECGLNAGVQAVALTTGKPVTPDIQAFLDLRGVPLFDSIADFAATLR